MNKKHWRHVINPTAETRDLKARRDRIHYDFMILISLVASLDRVYN